MQSLLPYIDEKIDESRGLEYLRNATPDAKLFRLITSFVSTGINRARKISPRGELDMSASFELVRLTTDQQRIIRVKLVVARLKRKCLKPENSTTFLILLDREGRVSGVYNDALFQ